MSVTPQRTQLLLDGASCVVVSEGAVFQRDAAAVGEQVFVQLCQPLRATVNVRSTARLAGVAAGFERTHDACQVAFGERLSVVARRTLGVQPRVLGKKWRTQVVPTGKRPR